MSDQLDSIYEVARRSFLRSVRQPAAVVPAVIFPLFLLAVNSAGLDAATDIPGFPTDSYVTFALAIPFIQGVRSRCSTPAPTWPSTSRPAS